MNGIFRRGAGSVAGMLVMALAVSAAVAGEKEKGDDWSFELGAGAFYMPDYEGSDDYDIVPVPILEINWRDRVSLRTKGGPGLYVTPYKNDRLSTEIGIQYEAGRDDSDNAALNGLGDYSVGAVAVGSIGYDLGPLELGFELARDMGGDRKGLSATVEAEYAMPLADGRARFSITPHLTWVNEDYMDTVFGVTATQSAASVAGLSRYDPNAGFKDAGITLGIGYRITDNVSALGRVGYTRLMSEAADSPIVADHGSANQLMAGVGITYSW